MDLYETTVIFYFVVASAPILGYVLKTYGPPYFRHLKASIARWQKKSRIDRRYKSLHLGSEKTKIPGLSVGVIILVYFFLGYLMITKAVFFAVVVSGSMAPTLNRGDFVLIETFHVEPEKGDIILFSGKGIVDPESGNRYVLHRVKSVKETGDTSSPGTDGEGKVYYRTQGDAVGHTDPWKVKKKDG